MSTTKQTPKQMSALSDGGHQTLAILAEAATPDLYHRNGFRVLELPADATPRDINRRKQTVEKALTHEVPVPPGLGRGFPLTPAPDQYAVREAMQRLGDPERRLVDELFWFWPHRQGESATDHALAHLREGRDKEAEGVWLELETEHSESSISTHNLAVMYHFMALEWEKFDCNGNLSEQEKRNIEKLWSRAFRRWTMLFGQEGFWSRLTSRIRELEDPRLTTGTARRVRDALPSTLICIIARLGLQAAEAGRKEAAKRLVETIHNSGVDVEAIKEGLRLAVEPVRNRIKALCKSAELAAEHDPVHADKTCQQLLENAKPLLEGLDTLLPADNPTRQVAHDDVAERALRCQVAFCKKTENWQAAVILLEAALPLATSESVRKKLQENLEIVKKNADTSDDFCGAGFYDAPSVLVEEMERIKRMADKQDYDQAIQCLESLLLGKSSVELVPECVHLVTKALAYCLGCRAIRRLNEALQEWNDHSTSVIRNIQNRAKEIDNITWMCADMGNIPQYTNCKCMADGSLIYGRYTMLTWTFNSDKGPVKLIICGNCGDRHRSEMETVRSKLKNAVRQTAQEFVDAGQLDAANKFVQNQITKIRKSCSDLELPFPSPSKQSKKAAKQQSAPPKTRTDATASGTSVQTTECAEAKKSLNWGIASLFFGALTAIPAVIYGHKALRKIKQSNGTLGGRAKARAGLVIGYAIIVITAVMIWYLAVEQPAQEKISFEKAVALAQQQAAAQKSADEKAKADAEAARLAEEKRKADELATQKAAQELAAKQAAEEKTKADEARRVAEETAATSILVAARDDDLDKVKALLQENPNLVFSKDTNGGTPLHWASLNNHKDVAEFLLANKAEINAKANSGMTPLHEAAKNGCVDVTALLLANHAEVNAKEDKYGGTPLHWAAFAGNTAIVKLLLANNADVNAKANDGATALQWANARNHDDVAELLREGNSSPATVEATSKPTIDDSIFDAAKSGDLEKVKLLIVANPSLVFSKNSDGWTPLHFAAAFGHVEVAELLLANKADANAKNNGDWTPLRYAVENGHTDVAELLRQGGNHVVTSTPTDATKSLFGDPVIVKAHGFTIKQSALDEVLTGAKANAAAQGQQLPSNFQVAVLNQLITIQLLLQKATDADRAAGKTDADLQFQNLLTRFGSTTAFERQLKAVGMTVDELRAKATDEAVAKAVLARELNITDADTVVRNSKIKNLAPDYVKKLRAANGVEILDPVLKAQAEQLGTVN